MSKRVLVLTDLYAPHFAPRIIAMVQNWLAMGWFVEVATEDIQKWNSTSHGLIFEGMEDQCPVYRFPLRKTYSRWESIAEVLWGAKSRRFEKMVEANIELSKIDIIVAFSYRTFPLRVAKSLARKYRKPFVCDCRDIVEQYPKYQFLPKAKEYPSLLQKVLLTLLKKRFIRQRNNALREASAVTTVSPWHRELLQEVVADKTVGLFYNGYDEKVFIPRETRSETFQIVFTGRLLSSKMTQPDFFFETLTSPKLAPILSSGDFEVCWYTDEHSQSILFESLEKTSALVQSVQRVNSMRPFTEVPKLLSNASLILMLADPTQEQNIVSTKIFEAMAMERPIILVRSDRSIRKELLEEGNAGWAIEEKEDLVEIIATLYAQWKKNDYNCSQKQNRSFVEQFSRKKIALEYASFLEKLCSQESPMSREKNS